MASLQADSVKVLVVYSPAPRQVCEWPLDLPPGSTVAQALQASGLLVQFPGLSPQDLALGIWGKKAGLQQLLREQDRLEVYRGLRVDPKMARRERFSKQGAKKSGLFSQKRPGAKAGY